MGIAAVDHLQVSLDELRGLDFDTLTDTELDQVTIALATGRCELLCVHTRALRTWNARGCWRDDGSKAAWARLARDANLSPAEAKADLRHAKQLAAMPLAEAALALGRISPAHIDLLARADQPWRHEAFSRDEALLVDWCTTHRYLQTRRRVLEWCEEVDPDGCERIGRHLLDKTSLTVARTFEDSIYINGLLDPVGGAIFAEALDDIRRELQLVDRRDGIQRTDGQRRAAALVEMAIRANTAHPDGRRPEPLICITVGDHTMTRLCQLSTGADLNPVLVTPYLSNAAVQAFVYDDARHVLGVSKQRTFRGWLRRAIQVRDLHCQEPCGCDAPITHCDVDHVTPTSQGGTTCDDNGRLRCSTHNRQHHHGYRAPPP